MKANVKLFAILREKTGVSEIDVDMPPAATVADLMAEIASRYPALLEGIPHIMVAVNTEYVQSSHQLNDGDEVALIPPVSGGAR